MSKAGGWLGSEMRNRGYALVVRLALADGGAVVNVTGIVGYPQAGFSIPSGPIGPFASDCSDPAIPSLCLPRLHLSNMACLRGSSTNFEWPAILHNIRVPNTVGWGRRLDLCPQCHRSRQAIGRDRVPAGGRKRRHPLRPFPRCRWRQPTIVHRRTQGHLGRTR